MRCGMFLLWIILIGAMFFNLGRCWAITCIIVDLKHKGESTLKYGDFNKHKVKLTGTTEKID